LRETTLAAVRRQAKNSAKADFAAHFGLHHEQMAWILPAARPPTPYGAARRTGTA